MAGLLAAQHGADAQHVFQDVAVSHLGGHHVDARLAHRVVEPEVRHHGRDDGVARQAPGVAERNRVGRQDLIAVYDGAVGVGEQRTVGVAVVGDAGVGAEAHDLGRHHLGVERAAILVDVLAVRLGVDRVHGGAEPAQHLRCDLGGRAVRAVHDDAHPVQGSDRRIDEMIDVAVARGAQGVRRTRGGTGAAGCSSAASISSSSSSGSFIPLDAKNLIPLYSGGLCEAEMTTPEDAPRSSVRNAIAGVGSMPASTTSPPAAWMPDTNASSSHSPEARGSRPTTNVGCPAP